MLEAAVRSAGDRMLDNLKRQTLVGRLGDPDEIAAMVVFLASERSSFVTGEVIGVSAGMGT
jgi:NAD(P)-dependent dehydrogenase (short-subunit alcohol dehydrogenase family)